MLKKNNTQIEVVGQIWNSLTNGMCYSVNGINPCIVCGAHGGCETKIVYMDETDMEKSKLNRYVRYIYRKMMSENGVQPTREQALRLFTLATLEMGNTHPSNDFINALLDLCIEWDITPKMGIDPSATLYQDLTPIRVRIRKLIPRECGRLMGVRDDDIDKIESSGISNSAMYKCYGNSIVVNVLMGIFTQLFRADPDSLF